MVRLGQARPLAPTRSTCIAGMQPYRIVLAGALAACAGGCAPSSAPTLTSGSAPIETGAIADMRSGPMPYETAIVVPGAPTEVYALVARGALSCWFSANGPLKATHVFRAEAAPPSQGGQAEIVLHERDGSLRDQRGARAFQVKFAGNAAGVRVDVAVVRIAPPLADLMVQDVEAWTKGAASCRVRALGSPETAAPLQPSAKTKTSRGGTR